MEKLEYFTKQKEAFVYLSAPCSPSLIIGRCVFLDDQVFNQKYISEFEFWVRTHLHGYYFSRERGVHYDQFEVIYGQRRWVGSAPYILKLEPCHLEKVFFSTFPFHGRKFSGRGLVGDFIQKGGGLKEEIARFEAGAKRQYQIKQGIED